MKYTVNIERKMGANEKAEFCAEKSIFLKKAAEIVDAECKKVFLPQEHVYIKFSDDSAADFLSYHLIYRNGKVCVSTHKCNDSYIQQFTADIQRKYLTFVGINNAYRFYEMKPCNKQHVKRQITNEKNILLGNGEWFQASFGRMAVEENSIWDQRTYYYPEHMYWIKYLEKIREGYKDISDVHYGDDADASKTMSLNRFCIETADNASGRLYKSLYYFARNTVEEAKINVEINPKIISKSKELVNQMSKCQTVKEFNDTFMLLMGVLQRPIKTERSCGVQSLIAEKKEDFAGIIRRERDLIQSMEGVLYNGGAGAALTNLDFSNYGIEVYDATDSQYHEVLKKLSSDIQGMVKNIYRVIPHKQKQQFDAYVSQKGIKNIKRLWHGSRNENWMSIIQNSLKLNPDAVITGKMFGDGIYFAPSSMKSFGYTSMYGSYWAKGNSSSAFMGLYVCAFGKPYDVYTWLPGKDYKKEAEKYNCLFAHKGNSLKNDEIIFYNEAAMCLQYIVEFHK